MNFYTHETYGESVAGVYDEWYSDYDPHAIDALVMATFDSIRCRSAIAGRLSWT
jgi:hypothetical protein